MANFSYTGHIYKCTNVLNGKLYIGKTINFEQRIKDHFSGNGNTKAFSKAILKYGKDYFKVDIVCTIHSNKKENLIIVLSSLERFYIKKFNSKLTGYNCTDGGEGQRGNSPSEEIRLQISKKLKGRKLSKERREAISRGHMGHTVSEESKSKLRETWLKRPVEERNKINAQRVINMQKNRKQTAIKIGLIRRKPILQYSLNGDFIREWDSQTTASETLGINQGNLSQCLDPKCYRKTCGGYKWEYKEEVAS